MSKVDLSSWVDLDIFYSFLAASIEAKAKVPHKLGIPYGSKQGQKLDYFGTDLPNGKSHGTSAVPVLRK